MEVGFQDSWLPVIPINFLRLLNESTNVIPMKSSRAVSSGHSVQDWTATIRGPKKGLANLLEAPEKPIAYA